MFHKSLLTAASAAILTVSAFAEEIPLMDTTQWGSHYAKGKITKEKNGEVTLQNGAAFNINKKFDIKPGKRYVVSFEACSNNPKGVVSVAFTPYTAQGRGIYTQNTICAPASLTEIAADAKIGDKSVKVKDISKFNKGLMGNCLLAFDAKKDFSDLPNFHQIIVKCPKPVQENGAWVLTLASPLKENLKAGTPVRQHYYGSAFYFNRGFRQPLTAAWKPFEASMSGISKQCNTTRFPRGTAKISLQIMFGDKVTSTYQIRNLKLSVIDK